MERRTAEAGMRRSRTSVAACGQSMEPTAMVAATTTCALLMVVAIKHFPICRCIALFLTFVTLVPTVSFAQRTTWVAVLVVYVAPADAVDWHGPWTRGTTIAGKNFFAS